MMPYMIACLIALTASIPTIIAPRIIIRIDGILVDSGMSWLFLMVHPLAALFRLAQVDAWLSTLAVGSYPSGVAC